MNKFVILLAFMAYLFGSGNCSYAGMDFVRLGDLEGGNFYSYAADVSADGLTVTGSSLIDSPTFNNSGLMGFRWTRSGGMVTLGSLTGGSFTSEADSISADGSVIVGISSGDSGGLAFRWTQESGMISLGDLPGGKVKSRATGVSSEGAIITGWSHSENGIEAFRWTAADQMKGLDDLLGGGFRSSASSVSADGSTITGYGSSDTLSVEAFRWTDSELMTGLGVNASSLAVSEDGSVIAGNYGDAAWMWTASQEDVVPLPSFPDNANGGFGVNDMSADGSIIAGQGDIWGISTDIALIWDKNNGYQSVQEILEEGGLDLTGWTLTQARGISADGKTIVGAGTNPEGNTEAFVAVIPEPRIFGLMAVFGGYVVFTRRFFPGK